MMYSVIKKEHDANCICGDDCPGSRTFITILYGRYLSWGIIRHRTQRIRELQKALEEMGHTIKLIPTIFWDRLQICIHGNVIFQCKLTNLERNPIDMSENPVCQRAINAVINSLLLLNRNKICRGSYS
ncbi:UPF0728 protein v1g117062-like [Cephus cinctus]|uniref:UPF0728 protein v1g117062-like n=1 Tax=Cephus cinctus TaxID=211228 RepID=A0AAJ7RHJ1_CEPCN|nr:UPF0728 protein v1g117062-like [Cephus cinctus]